MEYKDDYVTYQLSGLAAELEKFLQQPQFRQTERPAAHYDQWLSGVQRIREHIAAGQIKKIPELLEALLVSSVPREHVLELANWYFDSLLHLPSDALERAGCSVADIALQKTLFGQA